MAVIRINGDIIPNDDKWIYDWFGMEATCPKDVITTLESTDANEVIEVLINSGGGSVAAGQEIYSALLGKDNVIIKIQSLAGSAAGVIAMAGKSQISPIAMLMIHNVSMSGASGDYHDMQKNAEILKQMNAALAEAFVRKTGKNREEILKIMDRETWLTAKQCLEYGFVDEIMDETQNMKFTNCYSSTWLTDDIRQRAIKEKQELENKERELLEDLDFYGV